MANFLFHPPFLPFAFLFLSNVGKVLLRCPTTIRGVIEPNQYNGKLEFDSKFDIRYSARARSNIIFLARVRLEMKVELFELAQLGSIKLNS